MIILGVDPGYAIAGYGAVEYKNNRFRVLCYGAVTTKAGVPFNERLETLYDGLSEIIDRYKPESMAVEKIFYNSNEKTVIDVSQARGVLILAAQKKGMSVFEYTPLQVKLSVVGYGRRRKTRCREMTKSLLNLDEIEAGRRRRRACHSHLPCHSAGPLMRFKNATGNCNVL